MDGGKLIESGNEHLRTRVYRTRRGRIRFDGTRWDDSLLLWVGLALIPVALALFSAEPAHDLVIGAGSALLMMALGTPVQVWLRRRNLRLPVAIAGGLLAVLLISLGLAAADVYR